MVRRLEEQGSYSGEGHSQVKFDDLSKLEKPNLNWIITKRLDDASFWLMYSHSGVHGKNMFIGAVDAAISIAAYYWLLDVSFKTELRRIQDWAMDELKKFPTGSDNDIMGRSMLELAFDVALRKFNLLMIEITKNSKEIPIIDNA